MVCCADPGRPGTGTPCRSTNNECDACAHRFERIQKFSDALVSTCPVCGGAVRKLFSSPAIQFKGTGWYVTDYAKKQPADERAAANGKDAAKSKDADSAADSKSSSSTPAATDAKGSSKSKTGSSSSSASSSAS